MMIFLDNITPNWRIESQSPLENTRVCGRHALETLRSPDTTWGDIHVYLHVKGSSTAIRGVVCCSIRIVEMLQSSSTLNL